MLTQQLSFFSSLTIPIRILCLVIVGAEGYAIYLIKNIYL